VYNQDISVAQLIRGKLHLDYQSEPNLNSGNGTYLLQAVESHDGSTTGLITSFSNSVSEEDVKTSASNGTQLDKPLPDLSMVIPQPLGSYVGWFIPTLGNPSGGTGDLRMETSSTTTGSSSSPLGLTSSSTVTNVIGFSTFENASGLTAYVLTAIGSALTLYSYTVDTLGTLSTQAIPTVSSYTGSATAGWMAVNLAGTSSHGASVYLTHAPDSNGKYVTEVFDSNGLYAQWSGKDHVVAFLSTSRLLTREGSFYNVCSVSDSGVSTLYSFPAGTLLFAGEYYDSSSNSMRSRFTEALPLSQNGGQNTVRVSVYSIATADLSSLQQ
jgi:hypothetical protein